MKRIRTSAARPAPYTSTTTLLAAAGKSRTVREVPQTEQLTTNLAVEYRPTTFNDIAGQKAAVAVLKAAAEKRRPPQQMLLSGPSGTGKTTLARLFAAALFCPNAREGSGCGTCEVCLNVVAAQRNHPDVIELDAASHGGVDQVRDLAKLANLAPVLADYKIFIIDEAHGLTREGGQAFLRLLEEPPDHTVWILATTDPEKLPVALRGRCLQLPVNPPSEKEQVTNVIRVAQQAGWTIAESDAEAVIAATDEELGVRGTITTLSKLAPLIDEDGKPEPGSVERILNVAAEEDVVAVVTAVLNGNVQQAGQMTQKLLDVASPYVLRSQLLRAVRAMLHVCGSETQARKLARLLWHVAETEPNLTGILVAVTRSAASNRNQEDTQVSAEHSPETTNTPGEVYAEPSNTELRREDRPVSDEAAAFTGNVSEPEKERKQDKEHESVKSDLRSDGPLTTETTNAAHTSQQNPHSSDVKLSVGEGGKENASTEAGPVAEESPTVKHSTTKEPLPRATRAKNEDQVGPPSASDSVQGSTPKAELETETARAGIPEQVQSGVQAEGPFDVDYGALQSASRALMSGAGGSSTPSGSPQTEPGRKGRDTQGSVAVADLLTEVARQSARHAVALNKCRISVDGKTLTVVIPPHGPTGDIVQQGADMLSSEFTINIVQSSAD